MSDNNKRKVLTLNSTSNVKIDIDKISKKQDFIKKSNSTSEDSANLTNLFKSSKSSFNDLVKERQVKKNLGTFNSKLPNNKKDGKNQISSNNHQELEEEKSEKQIVNNTNSKVTPIAINAHKLLSEFAKQQREDMERKKEDYRLKKEQEERRQQEEELRKFNSKSKNNNNNSNENNNNVADEDYKKTKNVEKNNKKDNNINYQNNNINNSFNNQKNNFKKDRKKNYSDDYDDDGENNKKENRKKSVYTYVVSEDDDDFSFNKRRKKSFFKNKDKKEEQVHQKIIQDIELPEFITVSDLAEKMNEKRAEVVKKLISMGMPCTINQVIDADTAELLVVEFGHNVKKRITEHDVENKLNEEEGREFISRAPVVTIMGHVDHGKTSLLDAIRQTNVVDSESGGITQHIGASRVEVKENKFITFIDTPGHEAFTEMRMRGAKITDIVVLVVAADDGVKEQTIEAINHSKQAKVPIILAINKIDKPGADPSRVKQELLQHDIIIEEFGGDVMSVEVSAKQRINLDKLREAILLQAEIMNLKAPIDVRASGAIIEAKMDPKRGPIVTLLVQRGILKMGSLILAGTSYGKIKKMVDDKNKSQQEVYPSMAVEILGLDTVPSAGENFYFIENEKEAREIISYRERKNLENKVAKRSVKTLDSMLKTVSGKSAKLLPIIIKSDVNGSLEAIINSLNKLNTPEVEIDVIHSTTGTINETDINLAIISNAIILGFNVRANSSAVELAKTKDVDIRYYSIIYDIVDDVKNILSGLLEPIKKEEIIGHAEIRQIIKITGVGKIAGSFVLDGEIVRNDKIRIIRDGIVIYNGEIKALKRFKDDVKEAKAGYECGISIENFNDIKEKDIIECYRVIEEKRSL